MSEPIVNTNTNPENNPVPAAEKTFTQSEVDALIGKRIAKAMKGMPGEEELTAFRSWKASRQTEQDRLSALTKERDESKTALTEAQKKIEQYERERFLLSKGIPAEDVDYYAYKIAKMVTDDLTFEKATEQFLQEKKPSTVKVDFTAPVGGGAVSKTANETMNSLLRGGLRK